jgi:hypothetical protein
MPCHIGSNTALEQGVFGGQHMTSFTETNPLSFEQGKHRLHNPSHRVSLYNLYFISIIVHLDIGVQWNLVALRTPLQVILVTPMKAIK